MVVDFSGAKVRRKSDIHKREGNFFKKNGGMNATERNEENDRLAVGTTQRIYMPDYSGGKI